MFDDLLADAESCQRVKVEYLQIPITEFLSDLSLEDTVVALVVPLTEHFEGF
jgi:hypothetical protein